MNKFGKLIKCFIPLIVLLGLQVAAMFIYMNFNIVMRALGHDVPRITLESLSDVSVNLKIMSVFEIIAIIVFFCWYKFSLKYKFRETKNKLKGSSIGLIFLEFTAIEAFISAILVLLQKVLPEIMERYSQLMMDSGLADLSIISTLLTLVAAPIVEEIAFRGITMKWAEEATGKFWIANIIQAFMFGLAHLQIVQSSYAFILGLVLGYVARKYKSLGASIFGHLVFNFSGTYLALLLYGFDENVSSLRLAVILVLSVVVSVYSFLCIKNEKVAVEVEDGN